MSTRKTVPEAPPGVHRTPGLNLSRTLCLLVALCASIQPAFAQSEPPTRAETAQTARAAKAAAPPPPPPGRVEHFLTIVETSPTFQRVFVPKDGLGARIGTIDGGAGLAGGPSWQKSDLFDGRLHLRASAAVSTRLDRQADLGLAIDDVGTHRLGIGLDISTAHLAQNRFFGIGLDTRRADQTAFALDRQSAIGSIAFDAAAWLRLSASAGTLHTVARDAHVARAPDVSSRFAAATTTGFNTRTDFTSMSLSASVDYRDVPQNPRSGGRYQVAVSRYLDRTSDSYSFTQIDTALEQHLTGWRRQRLLTLRAVGSTSIADPGHDVPFYLQRTLGGSSLLRGFETDRFRDRSLLALQAEYGYDLLPFVSAVLFYEAGTVAPRWRDIRLDQLRRDYGIGFRFGSARTVALRTDVAFGSGEGTRLTMRFNHAF